jgi:hypothetical protein
MMMAVQTIIEIRLLTDSVPKLNIRTLFFQLITDLEDTKPCELLLSSASMLAGGLTHSFNKV